MEFNIIKIAFEPNFSESFKKFIRENVAYEFISDDEKKHQYFVNGIDSAMQESDISFMENDKNVIIELGNQNIEYVEF